MALSLSIATMSFTQVYARNPRDITIPQKSRATSAPLNDKILYGDLVLNRSSKDFFDLLNHQSNMNLLTTNQLILDRFGDKKQAAFNELSPYAVVTASGQLRTSFIYLDDETDLLELFVMLNEVTNNQIVPEYHRIRQIQGAAYNYFDAYMIMATALKGTQHSNPKIKLASLEILDSLLVNQIISPGFSINNYSEDYNSILSSHLYSSTDRPIQHVVKVLPELIEKLVGTLTTDWSKVKGLTVKEKKRAQSISFNLASNLQSYMERQYVEKLEGLPAMFIKMNQGKLNLPATVHNLRLGREVSKSCIQGFKMIVGN